MFPIHVPQSRQPKLLKKSILRLTPARAHNQWVFANCLRLWGGFPRYLAIFVMLLPLHLLRCFIHSLYPVAYLSAQEATQRVSLSSDSASSARGSHDSTEDSILQVRYTFSTETEPNMYLATKKGSLHTSDSASFAWICLLPLPRYTSAHDVTWYIINW